MDDYYFRHQPRRDSGAPNPYENRWRWWYPAIADWLIANPDGTQRECAKALGRGELTISYIMRTDMFRDYLSARRREWMERHDLQLVQKTTRVAEAGLDIMLEVLNTKRTAVPIGLLDKITTSALDRLGYGPQATPAVVVNNSVDNRQIKSVQVNSSTLEEARMAIRAVEAQRRSLPAPRRAIGACAEDSSINPEPEPEFFPEIADAAGVRDE